MLKKIVFYFYLSIFHEYFEVPSYNWVPIYFLNNRKKDPAWNSFGNPEFKLENYVFCSERIFRVSVLPPFFSVKMIFKENIIKLI